MRYFQHSEFDQKGIEGSGEIYMDRKFLSYLDALRHKCGFPFIITSGYRTSEYNAEVSTTGLTGPHTTGKAADIAVSGNNAYTLLKHAMDLDCFAGIGIGKRFIHLDSTDRPQQIVWTY